MSSKLLSRLLALVVTLLPGVGCYELRSNVCGDVVCPDGMECTADSSGCTATKCGNGVLDPGEACDDGNVHRGDNCRPDCTREECGNGLVDPGEDCDSAGQNSNDCNDDCTRPACGDGKLNPKFEVSAGSFEQCDQGDDNDDDVYGQAARCTKSCARAPYCGDGLPNGGEGCDFGAETSTCNLSDAARESKGAALLDSDCRPAVCGDGYTNTLAGEACDAGELDEQLAAQPKNAADCNADCSLPRCGDGKLNPESFVAGTSHLERCDKGSANSDAYGDPNGCTLDCLKAPYCGDGLLDSSHETCDAGAANGADTELDPGACTRSCTHCGDAHVDPGEECDDGNNSPADGCTIHCRKEECGNGVIDPGEACDDHNANQEDNCANCQYNVCGDHLIDREQPSTEQCDDGGESAGCNADCTLASCGDGVRNVSRGEICDGGQNGSADCDSDCTPRQCGDGTFNPKGEECDTSGDSPDCDSDCTSRYCGDGHTNGTTGPNGSAEECDDGNGSSRDTARCTKLCTISFCGDGYVNRVNEDCDWKNDANCSTSCKFATCGDHVVNAPEECDEGGESRTCDANCTTAYCGDGDLNTSGRFEQCDDANNVGGDGCSNVCRVEFGYACDQPGEACHPVCGDGWIIGEEQCDDKNTSDDDGCVDCRRERGYNCSGSPSHCQTTCGDGIIAGDEQCDDHNQNDDDGCTDCAPDHGYGCTGEPSSCQTSCGDGLVGGREQCDDDNQDPGDGCSDSCRRERGYYCQQEPSNCETHCGDGIRAGDEACDDNNTNDGDGCNKDCNVE